MTSYNDCVPILGKRLIVTSDKRLRKYRPNWTFDMCATYWKFAVELTGLPFNEAPNTNIQKIIQYATLSAINGFHTLIDKREKLAESNLPLTSI